MRVTKTHIRIIILVYVLRLEGHNGWARGPYPSAGMGLLLLLLAAETVIFYEIVMVIIKLFVLFIHTEVIDDEVDDPRDNWIQ